MVECICVCRHTYCLAPLRCSSRHWYSLLIPSRTYLIIDLIPIVLHRQLNEVLTYLQRILPSAARGSAQHGDDQCLPYRRRRSRYRLEVCIQTGHDIICLLQLRLHICNIVGRQSALQQCRYNFDGSIGLAARMNVLRLYIAVCGCHDRDLVCLGKLKPVMRRRVKRCCRQGECNAATDMDFETTQIRRRVAFWHVPLANGPLSRISAVGRR